MSEGHERARLADGRHEGRYLMVGCSARRRVRDALALRSEGIRPLPVAELADEVAAVGVAGVRSVVGNGADKPTQRLVMKAVEAVDKISGGGARADIGCLGRGGAHLHA